MNELLPSFCQHYGNDATGFRSATLERVAEYDATWFLRALSTRTVVHDAAFFRSALSGAKEQLFWHGLKSISPRPITLWVEPVITIGAAGRLHIEFGWPKDRIGLQSKGNWAFDLVAYDEQQDPVIVCEVKKTSAEIDFMIEAMLDYLGKPPLDEEPMGSKHRNSYRKVVGLRQMSPTYFWALGPDGYGKTFRSISVGDPSIDRLVEVDQTVLVYSPSRGSA